MKKTIYIALLIFSLNSYAQEQIIDILDDDGLAITNAYYKDGNNLLDSYEGTWIYTNGNSSFKIVLVKKVQQYNGRYYEDLIIGEYQFIENGVEKINTLSEINTDYPNQIMHKIDGNSIITKGNKPPCATCANNEKRLRLSFSEPDSGLIGTIIVRRITYDAQIAIDVNIRAEGNTSTWIDGQPQPPNDFVVHAGNYILIKQ